jgi:hypothetical protein
MEDVQEIYNTIYQSTFCVAAYTKRLYLTFFKSLIEKYLNDVSKNYHIYVSTTDKLLSLYQNNWPSHQRLTYITDGLVPTTMPTNINSIYFYHRLQQPSKDDQFSLVSFVETHPLIKYIFVGRINKLLPFTRIKLFHYYLHFEMRNSKWGRLHTGGIINYSNGRSMCRRYYSQSVKKNKVVNSIPIYDYFLLHNILTEESKICRFNKKIFKPKNKKPKITRNNTITTTTTTTTMPQNTEIKIKYIYTGARNNPTHLIMPDGSKENYKNTVNKYLDVIEI